MFSCQKGWTENAFLHSLAMWEWIFSFGSYQSYPADPSVHPQGSSGWSWGGSAFNKTFIWGPRAPRSNEQGLAALWRQLPNKWIENLASPWFLNLSFPNMSLIQRSSIFTSVIRNSIWKHLISLFGTFALNPSPTFWHFLICIVPKFNFFPPSQRWMGTSSLLTAW